MKKCKCTPELIEKMKENVKLGFTYSALSLSLCISEDSLYNWIRKGRDDKQQPYVNFYAALKETEAELLKECLDQLKLSMRQGNIESTKWLLERRFSSDGYGKQAAINVKSQNENLNLSINTTATQSETDKIRATILGKLIPKGKLPELPREAWQQP